MESLSIWHWLIVGAVFALPYLLMPFAVFLIARRVGRIEQLLQRERRVD